MKSNNLLKCNFGAYACVNVRIQNIYRISLQHVCCIVCPFLAIICSDSLTHSHIHNFSYIYNTYTLTCIAHNSCIYIYDSRHTLLTKHIQTQSSERATLYVFLRYTVSFRVQTQSQLSFLPANVYIYYTIYVYIVIKRFSNSKVKFVFFIDISVFVSQSYFFIEISKRKWFQRTLILLEVVLTNQLTKAHLDPHFTKQIINLVLIFKKKLCEKSVCSSIFFVFDSFSMTFFNTKYILYVKLRMRTG